MLFFMGISLWNCIELFLSGCCSIYIFPFSCRLRTTLPTHFHYYQHHPGLRRPPLHAKSPGEKIQPFHPDPPQAPSRLLLSGSVSVLYHLYHQLYLWGTDRLSQFHHPPECCPLHRLFRLYGTASLLDHAGDEEESGVPAAGGISHCGAGILRHPGGFLPGTSEIQA